MAASFMSAFIGQCFGLGGGFIYGPILLQFKLNPLTIASTCLYMIAWSGSASATMFLIFGRLNLVYFAWVGIFSGAGVFLGLCVMGKVMKRYNRPSLVAFALALAIIISLIISTVSSIKSLKTQVDNDLDIMKGDSVC